jgi:hypothetical protein
LNPPAFSNGAKRFPLSKQLSHHPGERHVARKQCRRLKPGRGYNPLPALQKEITKLSCADGIIYGSSPPLKREQHHAQRRPANPFRSRNIRSAR